MEKSKQIILGVVTVAFVFAPYFIGLFRGERNPIRWRELLMSARSSLTGRGIAWAVALPAFWVLLYYAFIAHVWFSLGRWPRFGENLDGALLSFHHHGVWYLLGALLCSLFVAPIVFLVCLSLQRWRHVSVYVLCYGAAIGLCWGALYLAPGPFLNWLFD